MNSKIDNSNPLVGKLEKLLGELNEKIPDDLITFTGKVKVIMALLGLSKKVTQQDFLVFSRTAEYVLIFTLSFKQKHPKEGQELLDCYLVNVAQLHLISIKAVGILNSESKSDDILDIHEFEKSFDAVFDLYMNKKYGDNNPADRVKELALTYKEARRSCEGLPSNEPEPHVENNLPR